MLCGDGASITGSNIPTLTARSRSSGRAHRRSTPRSRWESVRRRGGCASSTSSSVPVSPRPSAGRRRSPCSVVSSTRRVRPTPSAWWSRTTTTSRSSPSVSTGWSTVTDERSLVDRTLIDYVGLGAALRDAGVAIGAGQQIAFARALRRVNAEDHDDVYWAGRCCLITRSDDIAIYDRVFADWFASGGGTGMRGFGRPMPGQGAATARPVMRMHTTTVRVERRRDDAGRLASGLEVLRQKDFAACSDDELAVIARLLRQLTLTAPRRRSRRTERAPTGGRPDLRRALRDCVGDATRPGPLRRRRRRERARPIVLVLDVSGSMSAYSRLLLQFAWSALRATTSVEVFCFGTRLTRVTRELGRRQPDAALDDAAKSVLDWDGGTRIGESLQQLLREHSRRASCRGAVVVVCSDGLERGDPQVLATQLARLRRLSHRIVWVNPLSGDPRFEPVTQGMTAALPYVDALVAGHSLNTLEDLARIMSELA